MAGLKNTSEYPYLYTSTAAPQATQSVQTVFKIVHRESQGVPRNVKEVMFITVNDPSLNRNIGKYQLPHIWDQILQDTPTLQLSKVKCFTQPLNQPPFWHPFPLIAPTVWWEATTSLVSIPCCGATPLPFPIPLHYHKSPTLLFPILPQTPPFPYFCGTIFGNYPTYIYLGYIFCRT